MEQKLNIELMKNINNQKGYVALITVLIVGAVGLSIAVSMLLLSIGSSKTSYSVELSAQSRTIADSCASESLERIRKNPDFIGTKNLNTDYGNCSYLVIDNGGGNRTIQIVSVANNVVKKILIILDAVEPQPNMVSYQEIADF